MKPLGARVEATEDRLGMRAQVLLVGKRRFLRKIKEVESHLMRVGKSLLYPKLSRRITTKLVSKCKGQCVLTLRQKEARHCLHKADASSSIWLKRLIHQEDLAMKVVSSPLHHTQDSEGGPLTKEEQRMSSFENYLTISAICKMPPWLKKSIHDELMKQFGPSFDVFVQQLVINITLQLFMPWHKYLPEQYHYVHLNYINAYNPTGKDLLIDLIYKFHLYQVQLAEDVLKELVKKIELAFLEVATTEDKLALEKHKMPLADVQVENAST